jgi:DNA-binding CsgD family transcriptional regulator
MSAGTASAVPRTATPGERDAMLERVTVRVASPVFVGRRREQEALLSALGRAAAGDGGAVLVGGEAGIGKTRLVDEFATQARAERARVLVGGCLELGTDGLAFVPFTSALRSLVRELGTEGVRRLVPGVTELARLLPELGPPPDDAGAETARGRLFEEVLALLDALSREQPLVFVVEDLHWADRSTRELFAFVVRNVAASRILVAATYRTDELHRRHPMRPLLAELDRSVGVARVDLARFARTEVVEQAISVLGSEPDPSLVNTVYERSDGNPLFVETLLDCPNGATCGIDDSLRDLLLRTVEQLPEDTQQLLGLAAIGGVRVGHQLLAEVSTLDDTAIAAALRPAVDANVLVADDEGYRFRHALIREAVHDELLPGEHARLHARYAEVIEGDPSLVPRGRFPVETAHHWHAAHQSDRALAAAWRAAEAAPKAHAYAEQLTMLSRVLELWDAAPDPERRIGLDHVTVLEHAVLAAQRSGDLDKGLTFADAALAEIDSGSDPLRAAVLRQRRARLLRDLGRPGGMAEMREAARLTESDTDGVIRARALAELAHDMVLVSPAAETAAAASEALQFARRVGDRHSEGRALSTLGCVRLQAGQVDEAFAAYDRARVLAQEIGSTTLLLSIATNESDALGSIGDYERAIEVARRGQQEAQQAGVARTKGAFLAVNVVEPLVSLGRWAEAMTLVEETLRLDPPPIQRAFLGLLRAEVVLARGKQDDAAAFATRARSVAGENVDEAQLWLPFARLDIELAASSGDLDAAMSLLSDALSAESASWFPRYTWPLLATGARVVADSVRRPSHEGAQPAAEPRRALERAAGALAVFGPAQPAHRAILVAELTRADNRADVAAWQDAVAACERAREPYRLAYACFRGGEAATEADDRPTATELLRRAAAVSADLGARPLAALVASLARRARLALADGGAAAPPAEDHLGLTVRELDVLRLVAAGRSNGQIAQELFISPKTASVHVSNILAKLRVEGRGEAAALAHEKALLG